MMNLREFSTAIKEQQRKNKIALLILFVVFIPAYFVATQFTASQTEAVFISFLVAIVIGVSFSPFVSRFRGRPPRNERR